MYSRFSPNVRILPLREDLKQDSTSLPWSSAHVTASAPCPMCGTVKETVTDQRDEVEIVHKIAAYLVNNPREVYVICCKLIHPEFTEKQIAKLVHDKRMSANLLTRARISQLVRAAKKLFPTVAPIMRFEVAKGREE